MKAYTVKRGRYRTRRVRAEDGDLARYIKESPEAVREIYESATAAGELDTIAAVLGRGLDLDAVLSVAQRLAGPILKAPRPSPDTAAELVTEDPLHHFAVMLNYHTAGVGQALADADADTRAAAVEAVLLGFAWAQLITNQANMKQTKAGRRSQERALSERQQALQDWLAERGLRARDLRYTSRNRTAAMQAWAGSRVRGVSDSTFNRDLDALEAIGR